MKTLHLSRRQFVAAMGLACASNSWGGMMPNQVPQQEQGIQIATDFLQRLDGAAYESAFSLVSRRVQAQFPFPQFAAQAKATRARVGSRIHSRTLVGTHGLAPSAASTMPNSGGQAQWTIRFRSVTSVGAVYEDVHLELDNSRRWAIAGWFIAAG
jgi:hypothetical protein